MAKYGNFLYGTAKYGETARLVYSVEPMTALVLNFNRVYIAWQSPKGAFSRVRLVRNQNGFPETAEDGVIVFDEFATVGTVSRSYILDGYDNPESIPFVPGRQAYYRFFIFTEEKVWRIAGSILALIPSDHNAQKNFISILPRVYTSEEQNPLDAINTSSILYKFITGFSFTQEEFFTYLDLLRPTHSGLETPYQLIALSRSNVGLTPEPALPVRNQKRLIREAIYMYSRKGTELSLGTYVESLTGFAPTITVSPNALLTVQDSTFYQAVGNWQTSGCTLEASTAVAPSTNAYVVDTTYAGKVTAIGSSHITLGADAPVTKGIPVTEDSDYTFSYKVRSPGSAGSTQMTVVWYDGKGVTLGSDFVMGSISANDTWKTSWENTTSPSGAVYASLKITFSASGVYYVDEVYAEKGLNTDNTSYQEARAVNVFLNPNSTNYINNPSFEVNVTDSWTADGLVTVTQDLDVSDLAYSGTSSAKLVATGAWSYSSNQIPIKQGTYYTASGLIKATSDLTVTFIGRDSLGSIVETEDVFDIGMAADWSEFSISHLTDAFDASVATYEVVFSGDAGTFYLDCIQFEESTTKTDYFDGNLPIEFGAVWGGTADNSYTYLYPNKIQKVSRLANTLTDWLPMNTVWRLSTYDGVEASGITV